MIMHAKWSITCAAKSTRGAKRKNDDAFLVRPFPDGATGLFAVADGLSGHLYADEASALAIRVLDDYADRCVAKRAAADAEGLAQAIAEAGARIRDVVRHARVNSATGTTLTAVLIADDRVFIGHVGDSRLYRHRSGTLTALTLDDTVAGELVRAGCLSSDEYRQSPLRRRLARYLGREGTEARVYAEDLRQGDVLLLVTDGVLDESTDRPVLPDASHSDSPNDWIDAIFGSETPKRHDDATAVALMVK